MNPRNKRDPILVVNDAPTLVGILETAYHLKLAINGAKALEMACRFVTAKEEISD